MVAFNNIITADALKAASLLNVDGLSQDIGRTLVVAPHPDDEALGCGGLIALLTSQNTEVHVVFVTNGGASHPNSIKYNSTQLQIIRKKEAIHSCQVLGVEKEHVHFIGLEDSKLNGNDHQQYLVFQDTLNVVFQVCEFDSLATTYRNDAHNDHKATYKFCKNYVDLLGRDIQMIEYPIWLWKNGKPQDWPSYKDLEPFRLDISSVLETKEKAIFQHKSQTTRLIDDDPEGFILTEELLEPFTSSYEYYFFSINTDRPTLENSYFKKVYANSEDPWKFRSSRYERQKYLKTLQYLKFYRFEHGLEIGCSIGEHSNLLSRHCNVLTSIDINSEAIATAKNKFGNIASIHFKVWNVAEGLPAGTYDLITICEVGYYLNSEDLLDLFTKIDNQLKDNGMLLMVHWTPYVRDYPLTGNMVHRYFKALSFPKSHYIQNAYYQHTHYELILWQKKAS